jgi:zinc finger-like protein
LALAGADAVASYRNGNGTETDDVLDAQKTEPLVLCQPVVSVTSVARELGCKHYSRGVRLVAACCGAAHVCRFCHDEAEDHTIDRFATKEMVCMRCGERQPSSATCRGCGVAPAKYFCSVCNFWDDAEDVYHCPFCNVCRRGKGLGKDFFHCMQCNSCVSLTMGPHDCGRADGEPHGGVSAMESDCPVCKDFLWNSDTPVKAMPCGHMMHTRCFEAYTKHYYTCPLCRKSLGDFSAYFRMLDAILAEEREANAARSVRAGERESGVKTTQRVACNDCGEETVAPFHFVYHACVACRSYNTRVLGGPETTSAEAAL